MRTPLPPLCLALATLLTSCLPASAQQAAVGHFKRVAGVVTVERGGQSIAATSGSALYQGDRIRTGRDGYAGITLADDTLLTTGPGSLLVLSRFAFDPTTQEGEVKLSLPHGSLSSVSGLIAKKSPEKVEIKGRNVVLGVRGTEFVLEVPGDGE